MFRMMITSLMNTDGRKTTANTLNNIYEKDGAEDNSTIFSILNQIQANQKAHLLFLYNNMYVPSLFPKLWTEKYKF